MMNNKVGHQNNSECICVPILLTRFSSIFRFYNPMKRQKTKGFQTFLRCIEMEHLTEANRD